MTIRIHPGAAEDLAVSAHWYDNRQVGVGEKFLTEFDRIIDLIAAEPLRFARAETYRGRRELRRALLEGFPYSVIFEVKSDGILVLAVAHASRRQNYWSRRSE